MKKITLLFILFFATHIYGQWTQKGANINTTGRVIASNSDGTVVIVGNSAASKLDNLGVSHTGMGEVKVYQFDGTNWIPKGSTIDETGSVYTLPYEYGRAVAINDDGTRIAFATYNNVRTYEFVNSDWSYTGLAFNTCIYDIYVNHISLAMSNDGQTIVIGATNSDYNGMRQDKVTVYKKDLGNTWSQVGANIESPFYPTHTNVFGYSVSCNSDATRIIIGCPQEIAPGTGNVQVYDYATATNSWNLIDQINGIQAYSKFGKSVSMNDAGNVFVVGAPEYNGTYTNMGSVRVYEKTSLISPWTIKGSPIYPSGTSTDVKMGENVSIASNGDKIAVSLPGFEYSAGNTGRIKIYNYNASDWQFTSNIDYSLFTASSETSKIGLSGDGSSVAMCNENELAIYQNDALSVNDNILNQNVNLYPNPTKGNFTIDLETFYENISLRILTIQGKLVSTHNYNNTNRIVLDSNLPSGLYFVTISNEKSNKTIKIMVEN